MSAAPLARAQDAVREEVVVLARAVPVELGGWPSAERRLAAELAQAGHHVRVESSDASPLDVPSALASVFEVGTPVAALSMYVDGVQPFVCLALQATVECRPIDAAEDAEAVLVVVEWLHERLLARGLWHDPSAPPSTPPPPEPPSEPDEAPSAVPTTASPRFAVELLGGAHLAFDDAAPFGLLSLRFWIAPLDWLAIALEVSASVVPRTFADERGRASVGVGAARLRAFADLLEDDAVALGPVLAVGTLVAVADGSATSPYVGGSAASATFIVDGGVRFAVTLGSDVWLSLEARAHWAPPLFVRFESDGVVSLGGPGFAAELGLSVRI